MSQSDAGVRHRSDTGPTPVRHVLDPSLLVVLLLARVGALDGHPIDWSWWTPIAYLWHDAAVAALFGLCDRVLAGRPRTMRGVYAVVVVYIAVNVPVTRVLSTPMTWTMWQAARGPLLDSIRYYATAANIAWTIAVLGAAAAAPTVFRGTRSPTLLASLLLVAAAGPIASARVRTHGLERNAWTALALSAVPRAAAAPADRTWRAPRRHGRAADDLTWLRGAATGRHLVLVSLESTAAQYLGVYGVNPDVMPNLSALARDGVVFENAYAVYPESIKGLLSVLCSTYPPLGTPAETYARAPCASVASALREHGYHTALFHSGRFGYLGMDAVVRDRGFDVLADAGDIGGRRESSFGVDEESTVARMLEWIDRVPPRERFFVTYLPIAGHHPYEVPRSAERFRPIERFRSADRFRSALAERQDPEFVRYLNALHYGDAALGALIAGIRDRGLYDRTAWIVFGDHGEAFGQHEGNYGHTFQLYEENVHVPLIVAVPGSGARPRQSDRIVSTIDIAPTILDIAGVAVQTSYEGTSVLDDNRRLAMFFADYSLRLLGLRDGAMKFVYELDTGRSQLFDLSADPGETRDVADRYPDDARWYVQKLSKWMK